MRDEIYILNLCDVVLSRSSLRQHRFPFLRGDSGRTLPVDAYYPDLNLVVEYREKQHSESVGFFDHRMTVSGTTRGQQRAMYDQRRREVLPKNGIFLVEFSCTEFLCRSTKHLKRVEAADLAVIRKKLQRRAVQQCVAADAHEAARR